MMECTNPGLFAGGPDWLEPGEQRRQEALWQVARGQAAGEGGKLRLHVEACRGCARTVAGFRRLDRAARVAASVFAVCPGAQELSDYYRYELPAAQVEKVEQHLKVCPYCSEDLDWLARTEESNVVAMPWRRWTIVGAIAAAAAALALIPTLRNPGGSSYADLAQAPPIDRKDLLATLGQPEKFRPALEDSISAYDSGDYGKAETKVQPILDAAPSDPSALYVKAMAEYRKGNLNAAGGLMAESERTRPMSAFRCWSALQMALVTGNRQRIDRECGHLAGHPEYKQRVRQIRDAVARRGA
jgi:hypothetical protein